MIEDKDIEIKWINKLDISDHVPIEIVIKHGDWI